ncbi:MAG: peptide chain release factor N(5)-glutamine methyltransferase [Gemmatimonadota bacterium]
MTPDRDARPGESAARRPVGPTRAEILDGIARELDESGLEAPRLEAERLLAAILHVSRSELISEGGRRVTPEHAAEIARAVGRRLDGEPLQHIEGFVEFRRLVLVSDRRALIPRPETEQLVDLVADRVGRGAPIGRVLEVGVGSGAIALSLLEEGIAQSVVAVDVSAAALEQARENAARAGLADRLELLECSPSVWPDVRGTGPFDAVVSNPPYVASGEIDELAVEVRGHDPRMALDGGDDGLGVLRTVIRGAPEVLAEGGWIFLEIGADQGEAVSRMLASDPRWADTSIRRDLAGRPRFAIGRLGGD